MPSISIETGDLGNENQDGNTNPIPVHNSACNETLANDDASVASTVTRDSTCADENGNDLGDDDDDGDFGLTPEEQELLRGMAIEIQENQERRKRRLQGKKWLALRMMERQTRLSPHAR